MPEDATKRFSGRVDHYVRYRPGYPPQVVDLLVAKCGLTQQSVIADVGSGTGMLAQLFLARGNRVYAVEPNDEMRHAGESLLRSYPGFVSIAARAEATTLPAQSVDFVTVGQAFHWFRPGQARREFTRILRPPGWVALVWNARQTDTTPFLRGYESLLQAYAIDYAQVNHKSYGLAEMRSIFGPSITRYTFPNSQQMDWQGVKGRLLSSSYAPLPGHSNHQPLLDELCRLFERQQVDGRIRILYTTEVYLWCAQEVPCE